MKKVVCTFCFLLIILIAHPALASENPNKDVEGRVKELFSDAPDMVVIAKCESTFRQFFADGRPLYDYTGVYVGTFQVNEKMHHDAALALGYDLETLEGNINYARHLYDTSGTRPWFGCLSGSTSPTPAPLPAATSTATTTPTTPSPSSPEASTQITSYLVIGIINSQVLTLQKILNNNGYELTSSGLGSRGNETTKFGALTRAAVRKFQCERQIVCEGDESYSGYGRVGPRTLAALNGLLHSQ
jgi:hypothetical protein